MFNLSLSLKIINPLSKNLTVKSLCMLVTATVFTGCSSLGSGSTEKRAAKLSAGIQRAYSVEANTANRVSPMIVQSAERYDLDPLLLAAVIRQESSYRSYVTSPAGAVGLTQIIPRYWQNTCPGDLFDESTNIQCGSYIIARYKSSAGKLPKALAYYNVGPTGYNSDRRMKKQGKRYAKQVEQHQKLLKKAL